MNRQPAEIQVTTRRATLDDLGAVTTLLDLQNKFHAELMHDIVKRVPYPDVESWCKDQLTENNIVIYLAESAEIGVCGLLMLSEKDYAENEIRHAVKLAFVDELIVSEAVRGKGIGKTLLAAAEADAKQRGFDAISLNVWGRNQDAIHAYDALGFDVVYQRMTRVLKP